MTTEAKQQKGPAFEWEEAKPDSQHQPATADPLFLAQKNQTSQKSTTGKSEDKKQETNKNIFVSERGIGLLEKKPQKKPVYELLSFKTEELEEQNKKYLVYSQQNIPLANSFSKTTTLFNRKKQPVPL